MLLSVIIPTYNNAGTIEKCVKSALNQDYKDEYEVLVIENACTDNTKEILLNITDKKLRVVHNDHTVSQFQNHNIGLREAKSDYIVFLHSDDELLPSTLSIYAQHIKMHLYPPRYIACGLSMYRDVRENMWNQFSGYNRIPNFNTIFAGEVAMRIFTSGALFQPTGTCFSRDTVLGLGGFAGLDKTCPEDWYICAIAAYNYFEFEIIDRLMLKREYSSSWGSAFSVKEKLVRWNLIQDYFLKCLDELQMRHFDAFYREYNYPIWELYFNPLKVYWRNLKRRPWKLSRWKNVID